MFFIQSHVRPRPEIALDQREKFLQRLQQVQQQSNLLGMIRCRIRRCSSLHIINFHNQRTWNVQGATLQRPFLQNVIPVILEVVEKRLDKLEYARQKIAYCYFSVAATLIFPKLSDARKFWAKNGALVTVVDDFFDVGSSEEELVNLVQLIEEKALVAVLKTLRSYIQQSTALFVRLDTAVSWQGRNVTSHIVEIWLDVLKSMLKEAEWSKTKTFPTFDEYMIPGHVSLALGPLVLSAVYFVGPKLSKEVVRSPEFCNLFKHMGTCGCLFNDIQTFKRESKEGKWNAVSMQMSHSVTAEEIIKKIRARIDNERRELLRLVLVEMENRSIVPRACKDLFWNMSKVLHLLYIKDDEFTKHDMLNAVNEVIHEPISVDEL
ncbi:hypothetical protein Q3G72_002385 [Acer saccharum]|nr:hypothetical protein Q3G72_002385 [Acer saccharum]